MMMMMTLATLLGLGRYDAHFCPSAPSPILYQETVSLSQSKPIKISMTMPVDLKTFDTPNSAEVASKLVESNTGKLVGWLYLDERGNPYVSLVPYVDRALYAAFHMPGHNMHRSEYATEAVMQVNLRMPKGIEVRSCTQK